MATALSFRRMSSTDVRQQLADVLDRSQQEPIEIVKGGTERGKPIAVLLGREKFETLQRQAERAEAALRELSTTEFSGSADAQLQAFRQRVRSAIAEIHPKPKYTLAGLLAQANGTIPLDHEFLDAPLVGKEAL